MKRAFVLFVLVMAVIPRVATTETGGSRKGRFLTPVELAELGDESEVQYATTIVKSRADLPGFQQPGLPADGPLPGTPYPEISVSANGSRSLSSFRLSEIARQALEAAEPLFQAKQYSRALAIYRDASLEDPGCYVLYLSIGDSHLLSGEPRAALDDYGRAIALNPDDFHGYWFRASALVELGRLEEARHAYARALAMSPRNPELLKAINASSARLGFRAIEEPFHARAMARPEGEKLVIYTVEGLHWWLYGLCKAVWLAEAGHREHLTGSTEHHWTNTEELECMGNLLASYRTEREEGETPPEPELDLLLKVLDSGDMGGFVDYEFGSRLSEDYAILIDPESREKLVRFVERYVLQDEGGE